MRLIVFGPPGAGKGTQIANLNKHFDIKSISTGDLLRENIKNETEVGKLAQSYMNDGKLVPDDVINQLIDDFVKGLEDGEGFILDGFPRNVAQADTLEEILKNNGINSMDKAIYIDVPSEVIMERLTGRLTCRDCGAVFHKTNNPPSKDGVCDSCDGELYVRDDDKESAIKNRLEVFKEETEPLVKYYDEMGILYTLKGDGKLEEISNKLVKDLGDM